MPFTLSSPAFAQNCPIPRRYSGEGHDVSPPLAWTDPPKGTRSLVLTVTDPDAPGGTFHHWTLIDIPADRRALAENFSEAEPLGPMLQLRNGFGREGYGGPLPPRGHGPHRYVFTLHALSVETLDADPEADPATVILGLPEATLATASLVGLYER